MLEFEYYRGLKKMYVLAKQLKREKKDVVGGHFIKSNSGETVTEEEGIQEAWREYFCKLLNEENPSEILELSCAKGPVLDVFEEEVEKTLRAKKANKAPGPSGVSSDLLKCAGRAGIQQLNKVF